MEHDVAPQASLRIGELAVRTGVTPALLRAWERRYGVLQPVRTAAGYRLYTEVDEARVRSMQRLVASGLAAREAARLALVERDDPETEPEPPAAAVRTLAAALERFDESAAQLAFDDLLARYSTVAVVCDIALPYLADVGRRWETGEVTVAQEHFASSIIRARLLALARGWDGGRGPCAVLACPSGERHDIGLIGFGLVLRAVGWRVALLGADTPDTSVREAATRLRAAAVVVGLTIPKRRASLGEYAPAGVTLAVGGRGATPGIAGRSGAEPLELDLRAAADQLDRLVEGVAA